MPSYISQSLPIAPKLTKFESVAGILALMPKLVWHNSIYWQSESPDEPFNANYSPPPIYSSAKSTAWGESREMDLLMGAIKVITLIAEGNEKVDFLFPLVFRMFY